MDLIKRFKIIILVLGTLLTLVVFRSGKNDLFKKPASLALEAIHDDQNLITQEQLNQLSNPGLVIAIGSNRQHDSIHSKHSVQIPIDQLLAPSNRKMMDEETGALILSSDDLAYASRVWVILNQLGYKNLKILVPDANPESLKYKFQPDTTARLEQDSL